MAITFIKPVKEFLNPGCGLAHNMFPFSALSFTLSFNARSSNALRVRDAKDAFRGTTRIAALLGPELVFFRARPGPTQYFSLPR
jgi:hypothetical protein